MPIERNENKQLGEENSSNFALGKSTTTETKAEQQIDARGGIRFFVNWLTAPLTGEPVEETRVYAQVMLEKAIQAFHIAIPISISGEIRTEILQSRLRVVRELADIITKQFSTQAVPIETWQLYDNQTQLREAQGVIAALFNTSMEHLGQALEVAQESVWLLYNHDPVAFNEVVTACVIGKDSQKVEASLRIESDVKAREKIQNLQELFKALQHDLTTRTGSGYELSITDPEQILNLVRKMTT